MDKWWRKFALVALSFVFTTGCWDRVEIEERGFVVGAAIDAPKKAESEEDEQTEDRPRGKRRYALTYQAVIPGKMESSGSGEGGDSQNKSFVNFTSTGDSLFDVTRTMSLRVSRTPFLQHLKVLLISSDVAEHAGDFANAVDFFIRFHETRRNTHVFIVDKGDAADAFEVTSSFEELVVDYIDSIAGNHIKTSRILEPVSIGRLEEKLLIKNSYAIPRLVVRENDIRVSGVAIFDGDKNRLVGLLGEEETMGLSYLRGEVYQDVIKGQVRDNLVTFAVDQVHHRIKVDARDADHLKFTIELDVKGELGESLETLNHLQRDVIEVVESSIEKEIKRLTEDTLQKLQKEFGSDVIGLGAYLKGRHPKLWTDVSKEWDSGKNYFSKSFIDIKVNVIVLNPGIVTESERRG